MAMGFYKAVLNGLAQTLGAASDSSGTIYPAHVQVDQDGASIGTIGNPLHTADATVATVLAGRLTVAPPTSARTDKSVTSAATGTLAAANAARNSIAFQVPTALTGGLYISWTGTAGIGTAGSYFFPAGLSLVSLDCSVVGTGAITYATSTLGVMIPASEG